MKFFSRFLISGALPLLLLTACGGGSNGTTPPTGAALPGSGDTPNETSSTVVNGRVADGYIQGATVCVDVNENGACDPEEPFAITGTGGSYALDIPVEHVNKPIIASVPENAIDEDTGEAIGKKLVLSTPHDRPEFISPITTLVHEELKGNPNLSTDAAEAVVRDELGLDSDADASLFTDYVANQDSEDSEDAEHYRFLHQTARVVASMMDDVQDRVEAAAAAATNGGVDFTGDAIAQEAIRKLVRKEVRDLLPEISRAVAEKINEQLEAQASNEPVGIVDEIDPDKVVETLRPADLETDVLAKIDAIRNESEVRKVAMETLLKEGIYWIDVECDREHSHCYADYGHITVTGEDNTFTEEQFEFDFETNAWVMREQQEEEDPFALVLKDGKWETVSNDDVAGSIEFLADGGALFTSGQGKMVVYATAHDLDDTPVIHHLRKREVPPKVLELVEESALFPTGAVAHQLHIKRQARAHVLFNWAPDEFDQDSKRCAEFGGNCNFLESIDANGVAPIVSLNDIIEGSVYGFEIAGVVQHQFQNLPLNVKLTAGAAPEAEPDQVVTPNLVDESPTEGVATWLIGEPHAGQIHPAPGECVSEGESTGLIPVESNDFVPQPPEPTEQKAELVPVDENFDSTINPEYQQPPCEYPVHLPPENCQESIDHLPGQAPEEAPDDDCFVPYPTYADEATQTAVDETEKAPAEEDRRVFASSRWKTITVQGVKMIEIGLPVAVKQNIDIEEAGSMLLIEQDGYVRRGARLSDAGVSDELTYSLPAFETVEPILRSYIMQQQQQ